MSREIEQILKNQVVIMGMLQDLQDELEPIQNIEDTHQLLVDKNNGWIRSEDRMPEDDEDVLVWFEYFRFGEYQRLFQTTGIGRTWRGEWSGFVNGSSGWRDLRIIAWQPLPEPYSEEQEDE